MKVYIKYSLCMLAMMLAGLANVWAADSVLDVVKARGKLNCGIGDALSGFSDTDQEGLYTGFDVDLCRAVAAAVLGDAQAVSFSQSTGAKQFEALTLGQIDVLIDHSTWTFTRDASLGMAFTNAMFYDGQGIMVKKSRGISKLNELSDATICVIAGSTSELNLADIAKTQAMTVSPAVFESNDAAIAAFDAGKCDAYTADKSNLMLSRHKLKDPSSARILAYTLSKEPWGPAVKAGDDRWFATVRWVMFGLLIAEEQGISADNVDIMQQSGSPEAKRLLGGDDNTAADMGLSQDFMYQVIKQVGNYGELYARNLGSGLPTYVPRGVNTLWTQGGLLYAPPFR